MNSIIGVKFLFDGLLILLKGLRYLRSGGDGEAVQPEK